MQLQHDQRVSRFVELIIACGLVISINGYDSRVVDQCYRLPLLERLDQPGAFPADQFVDAFEKFNPHLGYLRLLQCGSFFFGLSITLFLLYCLTLALTTYSLWRIRESLLPDIPRWSNWLLLQLFVLCKAGNLGTNHLWEDHLLDRQIAFSLGWYALALWIDSAPSINYRIPAITGLIAIIHPGLGLLNLALWFVLFGWNCIIGRIKRNLMAIIFIAFVLCMAPWGWLYLGQSSVLKAGVRPDLFWSLATEIQGPQHMRPSLWRSSQWYAALSLFVFSMINIYFVFSWDKKTSKYIMARQWVFFISVGLFISWLAIEYDHQLNITLAQPWRLATPLRGLFLILILPVLIDLFSSHRRTFWAHACVLILSLQNDLVTFIAFSIAILVLFFIQFFEAFKLRHVALMSSLLINIMSIYAIYWLYAHDPQRGHWLFIAGYLSGCILFDITKKANMKIDGNFDITIPSYLQTSSRKAMAIAWIIPLISLVYCGIDPSGQIKLAQLLATKWRIYETPRSDAEKMGFWLNANLPQNAMILSPPRDKSIRAWSHRSIVANVAGSPYQAEELKKWAERIATLCGFSGDLAEFARQWPDNRVRFETYYEKASPDEIIAWAKQFQADVIVVPSAEGFDSLAKAGWSRAHVEGRLAAWLKK
ncbi:MAG: DUF6798 domain-containing protein [bacterium]